MSESDDADSKTEDATPQKLKQALEKGQTAVSREVSVLASLIVFTAWLTLFSMDAGAGLSAQLKAYLEKVGQIALTDARDAVVVLAEIARWAALPIVLLLVALMVAGLASAAVQAEPRMVADRIAPKGSRLSIPKGAKRIFGSAGLVEFAKALVKVGVAGTTAFLVLWGGFEALSTQLWFGPETIAPRTLSLVLRVLQTICGTMLLVAVADYFWTRRNWAKGLRMTKKEVTDETKQSEGDPILKSRLRSLAQDRSRNRMMSAVPDATFVIANPTHYAIALRYRHGDDAAPVVVAKGTDLLCFRIREIAKAAEVPVVENKELTRAVYPLAEVGEIIPERFFRAVADLINKIERGV